MSEWGNPPKNPETRSIRLEFALLLAPVLFAIGGTFIWLASPLFAHPGGLAADGCHNDRKNGGRHCHRGSSAGQSKSAPSNRAVYYPNCAAARAAGAAPIYSGQPGYGKHLDRDGDGKACE
ncbi:excalibur calcium-binding domain-containing protein [Allopontixanthobacter confluentis]|uniref:excalibur calcium-binding domain-containing protein n=1 Tax=Allopontixanthobacter confluentis TaxID=1849021 RepID=UPI002FCD6EC2